MISSSSIAGSNRPRASTLTEEAEDFCFGVCLEESGRDGGGELLATAGSGGSTTSAGLSIGASATGSALYRKPGSAALIIN